MPFILLLIGAVIAIAAFNNSQGDLVTELEADVPPFIKWGLAVFAVGALGWIPGMSQISRWLLALVVMVLVLSNYQQIIAGFQALGGGAAAGSGSQAAQAAANPTPAAAYAANPNNPQVTQAEVSGTSGTSASGAANLNANAVAPVVTNPLGAFDPGHFLAAFEAGFGGFGGVV